MAEPILNSTLQVPSMKLRMGVSLTWPTETVSRKP